MDQRHDKSVSGYSNKQWMGDRGGRWLLCLHIPVKDFLVTSLSWFSIQKNTQGFLILTRSHWLIIMKKEHLIFKWCLCIPFSSIDLNTLYNASCPFNDQQCSLKLFTLLLSRLTEFVVKWHSLVSGTALFFSLIVTTIYKVRDVYKSLKVLSQAEHAFLLPKSHSFYSILISLGFSVSPESTSHSIISKNQDFIIAFGFCLTYLLILGYFS